MKKLLLLALLQTSLVGLSLIAATASLDLSSWFGVDKDTTASKYQTYHETSHTGSRHSRSIQGFNSLEIKYDGEIRVSDDDRSIRSISPGGYLKISYRTFGNRRELIVNSDRSGHLSYEFYEGRREIPFEPDGRKWLGDVLPDVIRSTGIDAEGRTARIYARLGLDGFLGEVSRISSNSVKRKYFHVLLSEHQTDDQELIRIADAISRELNSSSSRGWLLREHADQFLRTSEVAAAYFSAVSKIPSSAEQGRVYRNIDRTLDFRDPVLTMAYFSGIDKISSDAESGSVLRHTIEHQMLPKNAQIALLESVDKLSSNSEAGRVLRATGEVELEDPEIVAAYFRAVDHFSSNSEAGSVLRNLLKTSKVEGPAMVAFLNSCRKMSSNSEIGSVLRSIQDLDLANAKIREAYFSAVLSLSSDAEKGLVLRKTLEMHPMNIPALISFYEVTRSISSNSETGSVLRESLSILPADKAVLDAFFTTVNQLSSPSEQGRVLRQYASTGDLSPYALEEILNSARKISSNSEKGYVLRTVAPRIRNEDSRLKELYMDTARTLSSDSEFRRAMEAIM